MTARTFFQVAAWLCIVAIGVLSLVTPSLRPVTSLPQSLEHAAIFAAAGFAAALGYPNRTALLLAAFAVFAGAVELAQLFAPGRHARLADLVVGTSAACAGVLLAVLIARWRPRIVES